MGLAGPGKKKKGETKKLIPDSLKDDEAKYIYRNPKGKIIFTPINQIYTRDFYDTIVKNTSIKTDWEQFKDTGFAERYFQNAAQFASAKSTAEAKLLQEAIFDDAKKVRTYDQFKPIAKNISEVSNETWLRVEYDMCRRQAVQAEAFKTLVENKDLYPYWVWHGMMDDREREEHIEMEGKVFKIGDDAGDAIFPPADWNCRCDGDPVDDIYVDENKIPVQTPLEAESLLESNVDPQFRYNPLYEGMMPKTGSYFDVLGDPDRLDYRNYDLPRAQQLGDMKEELETLTPHETQQYKNFERDGSLQGEDAAVQELSILKLIKNSGKLVNDYLQDNGNVVNTDYARLLFKDVGYRGSNSAAVHEASSVVSKRAYNELTTNGPNKHVSFYAGGSGSGKTSSIEGLFPGIREKSDAIMDGNLSSYDKALKQVNQLLASGSSVDIVYVYRTPEEAWEGVIGRMLYNKSEMGRLVPMSTFLNNQEGSYRTIQSMFRDGLDKVNGVKISIVDNSLGRGKAALMPRSKFDSIAFPPDLKDKVQAITQRYYNEGKITLEQFTQLNL